MGFATNIATHLGRQCALAMALVSLGGAAGCGGDRDRATGGADETPEITQVGAMGEPPAPPLPENATLEQALAHRDPLQRVQRVAQILEHATPDQLDTITAAIESAPLAWGDLEYALFAGWWARFDPASAMAYCDEELRLRHPRVIAEVLREWGRKNPQEAVASEWLGATSDTTGLNPDYVDPLVVGWFESGQPGLETWIEGLDPATKSGALPAYMRMRILRDGRRPALEWSLDAPYSADVQRLLVATGLNIVARQEPALAIEFLDRAAKKGIDVRTFIARIGRGWANTQPREAMEWVVSQDVEFEGERWRAVGDIARIWLNRNEQEATDWLATKSEPWADLVRKQAIMHHLNRNRYRVDWLDMMKRASQFVNPEQRQLQYLANVQRWKAIDPEAASKWIAENKALLGDKIEFVDQLPTAEFHAIQAILKETAAAEKS